MGPYLFHTQNENGLLACAYSWQLTGNKGHAGKVALFLRRLSDPRDGYPVTLRGCNQSLVQEGHFFQHIAMAYDMILDSGVLTDADRAQIEATFRIFMQTIDRENRRGAINNWNLSEDDRRLLLLARDAGPGLRGALLLRPLRNQGSTRQGNDG